MSAQIGNDTLTCYDNAEMQRIANRIVYANECDTLLKTVRERLEVMDSVILDLRKIIEVKSNLIFLYKKQLANCVEIRSIKDSLLKEEVKKNKILRRNLILVKIGAGIVAAAAVLIIL